MSKVKVVEIEKEFVFVFKATVFVDEGRAPDLNQPGEEGLTEIQSCDVFLNDRKLPSEVADFLFLNTPEGKDVDDDIIYEAGYDD